MGKKYANCPYMFHYALILTIFAQKHWAGRPPEASRPHSGCSLLSQRKLRSSHPKPRSRLIVCSFVQSGPVQAPSKTRYGSLLDKKPREAPKERAEEPPSGDEEGDDEELSEASQELEYDDDEDDSEDGDENEDEDEDEDESGSPDASDEEEEPTETQTNGHTDGAKRERKRKRKDDYEDLEDKYLSKLADEEDEEDAEPAEKRQKSNADEEQDDDPIPQHESLAKDGEQTDIEKANRTVYLANVCTTAISSKTAKKELLRHMASVLDSEASPPEKVESIRFRSVAFSGGGMPKRAAYITGQLMDATTKSANAYVVYSTVEAARKATSKLNGSLVLERHIRVDSVAHPARADHRRCVFVGNLGFVDDESVLNTNEDGQTVKKKRNKTPADIEEGLWRTFSTQGKVESVRVPRDPKSRVGKGIAYVQFYVSTHGESAHIFFGFASLTTPRRTPTTSNPPSS